MNKPELSDEEIQLIIKGLTTGQFHIAEYDKVFKLVTKLRSLSLT